MITALVNTARVSWMMGILRASQDERFQRTPARQTQRRRLHGHHFPSSGEQHRQEGLRSCPQGTPLTLEHGCEAFKRALWLPDEWAEDPSHAYLCSIYPRLRDLTELKILTRLPFTLNTMDSSPQF